MIQDKCILTPPSIFELTNFCVIVANTQRVKIVKM